MGYPDRKSRSMSMRPQLWQTVAMAALLFAARSGGATPARSEPDGYAALVNLFRQWREFEHPVMKNNVPDYSESAMAAKAASTARVAQAAR